MDETTWKDDDEISWRATPYRAPVLDSDRNRIGTAESLLADDNSDIFHGLAVKLDHGGRIVEVPAQAVTRITLSAVQTSVASSQVAELHPYSEEHWFHLGWGGLFRQRPEWKED